MILDRLEYSSLYRVMSEEIALALDFLRRTDFSTMPAERHNIDGDRVYAMVQRYRPKAPAEAKWEAHRRYIDIQYVAAGVERMGHAFLENGLKVAHEYDDEKDYILYDVAGDLLTLRAGSFMILAPHDIHAPGLAIEGPGSDAEVCKVVVKCRMPY